MQLNWFRANTYKVKLPNLYSEIFEISNNCIDSSMSGGGGGDVGFNDNNNIMMIDDQNYEIDLNFFNSTDVIYNNS